jgi:hypothetical protein
VLYVRLRIGAGMVDDAVAMIRRRIERIELQWIPAFAGMTWFFLMNYLGS